MKLLADENIARSVVQELRNNNFDVKDMKEENLKGATDRVLINLAYEEDRIIITHDKNFGNVLNQFNIKHKGVLMIRCKNQHYLNVIEILIKFLNSKLEKKCKNAVVVLSENQVIIHENVMK